MKKDKWFEIEAEETKQEPLLKVKKTHGFRKDAKPLIICYPKLKTAQLLATKSTNYKELQEKSKTWNRDSPYLKDFELVSVDDLTHNNIILRQINCSQSITRLLEKSLKDTEFATREFDFTADYYGDKSYWLRLGWFMRLVMLLFVVLYIVETFFLRIFLSIFGRFDKLNIVIQMQKKLRLFNKTRIYLYQLTQEYDNIAASHASYPDHHFYKLAIFIKFRSLVTHLVVDVLLGVLMLFSVAMFTD